MYDNGVAGIHIMGSNNFTFEATIADECWGEDCVLEGEGNVGSLDGQQPIEVIVETSTDVKFQDMRVESDNGESMKAYRLVRCNKNPKLDWRKAYHKSIPVRFRKKLTLVLRVVCADFNGDA